ncbi:glycosyltransferase [bacterium]|nr:glycosyltransferase [bacterium]
MKIFGRGKAARPRISVTVVTQDQDHALEGLLANVESFAHEIVVVDGGSKDGTERVARSHPLVRYFQHPWDGHYGKQKNRSFERATGDWILHLDTDERVGEKLVSALPSLCTSRFQEFYRIPMYWLASESPLLYVKSPKHYPCTVPRLFRNVPEFRYEEDGHPVHVSFSKPVRRRMKKLRGMHLFHYVLAWLTRDELRAKVASYAASEPGSEETNAAYYLWWEHPHELLAPDELPHGARAKARA